MGFLTSLDKKHVRHMIQRDKCAEWPIQNRSRQGTTISALQFRLPPHTVQNLIDGTNSFHGKAGKFTLAGVGLQSRTRAPSWLSVRSRSTIAMGRQSTSRSPDVA